MSKRGKNSKITNRKDIRENLLYVGWIILCVLSIFSIRMVSWVFHNWGNLRMDELIFTLTASLEGTNPALIRGAIFYVLPWCLLVLVLAIVLLQAFRIKGWNRKRLLSISALLSSITIIGSLSYFGHRVGFID